MTENTIERFFSALRTRLKESRVILTAGFASSVAGVTQANAAMDFQAGMQTLGGALLTVFGVITLVTAGNKAWEAVNDHRNVIPSLVGLVFGISLIAGGGWYLTQLGAGGGGIALNL